MTMYKKKSPLLCILRYGPVETAFIKIG